MIIDETKYLEQLMEAQLMLREAAATIDKIANRCHRQSADFSLLEKERLRHQSRANDEAILCAHLNDVNRWLLARLALADDVVKASRQTVEEFYREEYIENMDRKPIFDMEAALERLDSPNETEPKAAPPSDAENTF